MQLVNLVANLPAASKQASQRALLGFDCRHPMGDCSRCRPDVEGYAGAVALCKERLSMLFGPEGQRLAWE